MALLHSTLLYYGSTSPYLTLYITLHCLYFIQLDITLLWLYFTQLDSTLLYHGSTSLYLILHYSTIALLHSTWLYIILLWLNPLHSTLLYITLPIRKGFEAFKSTFEPFGRDSKHLNENSNHLKGIRSIRMQILTIQTKFETFKCKFEPFEGDSKHSNSYSSHWKGFKAFESKFEPFERSKNSNVNSNRSKEIRSIWMQIETIRKGFEGFEC